MDRSLNHGFVSVALIFSFSMAQPVFATPGFNAAKAAFDRGEWVVAGQGFDSEVDGGTAKAAEAAAFSVRSWRQAGRHDLVEQRLAGSLEAAAGTGFATRVKLERARSLADNAGDYGVAAALLGEILTEAPQDVFTAPGALLARADLNLKAYRDHDTARADFEDLLSRFPSSVFADDALLGLVRCATSALDPQEAQSARDRLSTQFPGSVLLPSADLELADFANRIAGDRRDALIRFKRITKNYPGTRAAATARLRQADMFVGGDFRKAVTDYQSVLKDFPSLQKNLRDWAGCQIGICHWQLGEEVAAREAFESVVATSGVAPNILKSCQLHLKAFSDPESIEMILVLYDRGLRWRAANTCRDLCWRDFHRIQGLSLKPFFEAYCTDSGIPVEERAQMRYRMALIAFEAVDHDSVGTLAQKALDLNPQGITRQMANFMIAYHHGHCGHHCHSIPLYRQILEERPDHAYLVPQAYMELARAQEKEGDLLGAALTCEEFRTLYPYRAEAKELAVTQSRLMLSGEKIQASFTVAREALLAKLGEKAPPLLLTEQQLPAGTTILGPISYAIKGGNQL